MFRFLEPFFRALNDGKIIRLTIAWVVRGVAVLSAIVGVLWFVTFIAVGVKATEYMSGGRSAALLIGSFVFGLFGLAVGYLSAGICFYRARTILELGDRHFTVLSIVSILFRLNGELIFVTYSLLGVGACLFVWLTEENPFSRFALFSDLPFAERTAGGFLGGLELMVIFLLLAFVGIVVCYALAELSIVLVEIALNTRKEPLLVHAALAGAAGDLRVPAPEIQAIPVAQSANGSHSVCSHCRQTLDAGAAFCAECGSAAR